MKPTFNLTLWRWELNGSYCSPERAVNILGEEFATHLKQLALAAGYPSIWALEDARTRAAWNR